MNIRFIYKRVYVYACVCMNVRTYVFTYVCMNIRLYVSLCLALLMAAWLACTAGGVYDDGSAVIWLAACRRRKHEDCISVVRTKIRSFLRKISSGQVIWHSMLP